MCRYCFNDQIKEATLHTIRRNRAFADYMKLDQKKCVNEEYETAGQHCIYPVDELEIKGEDGRSVWNLTKYSFLKEDKVPDTVNPSLWINGKSNLLAGVFEVVKGAIYQVRGFDISNLTIIRSKTGWIVQDVMTNIENSSAAIDLLEKALKEPVRKNIRAVIISHSHGDHFGGIKGVVQEDQVGPAEEGLVPVYVPGGFDIECVKENIFAGPAMGRRAVYQFGGSLEPGDKGTISTGLGFAIPKGTASFITPTDYITENKTVEIDGIKVEFQLTPGTEAPAEMNNYFADYRALWIAENCNGTFHNLYPIRGAQLRDAQAWSSYILEAIEKFGDRSDVVFQSHNWPHFNTKEKPDTVKEYLLGNAAVYKYIHDQTLLYANEGYTAKEVAKKIDIPKGLQFNWYTRPYYGTPQVNARAVYTKYLGFYNGIPTDLDPLTEVEEAKLFVEYAGGGEKVLERATDDYQKGEYRRAANAAQKLVFAEPDNIKARQLTADSYEQLAYTSESGIWRNAYLQGAYELRRKPEIFISKKFSEKSDLAICMSTDLLLSYLGILLDYDKVQLEDLEFTLEITDGNGRKEDHQALTYKAQIYAGIFLVYPGKSTSENYVKMPRTALQSIFVKQLEKVKPLIDTNIYEVLVKLQDAVIDLKEYKRFNLIEP